jgi:hypothetical protein
MIFDPTKIFSAYFLHNILEYIFIEYQRNPLLGVDKREKVQSQAALTSSPFRSLAGCRLGICKRESHHSLHRRRPG